MKSIKEIIKEIEHIPKCPRSGEMNLYYIIKLRKKWVTLNFMIMEHL